MSSVVEAITSVAVDVCWRQWSSLRSSGTSNQQPVSRAIIDPEALLLLSLAVRHRERRLQDALLWCASVGSTLLSVQRVQTLSRQLPASRSSDLAWFAARCVDAGDRRWRGIAGTGRDDSPSIPAMSGKGPDELRLLEPSTLMLRLRAGLGVGAKADLLAFLLGMTETLGRHRAWVSAEHIAKGISYSAASVRRAASDMLIAGFVEGSGERPMEYSANAAAWAGTLALGSSADPGSSPIPPWRFCSQMFAFLVHIMDWVSGTDDLSPVVRASRARDIVEEHRQALRWNGFHIPDARQFPGPRYLDALQSLVESVALWADEQV